MSLSKKDVDLICQILGQKAVSEAEKGNEKSEQRIFKLIEKLKQSFDLINN